jgi:carboxylesterase type B
MKKYLLKLLLWWYRKAVRDFTKLTSGEEFYLYRFGSANDVVKLLKYLQTTQILWHFESKTKDEQLIVKGASMMLKIILDSHNQVLEIIEQTSDEGKQLAMWEGYRSKNRTT